MESIETIVNVMPRIVNYWTRLEKVNEYGTIWDRSDTISMSKFKEIIKVTKKQWDGYGE